MSMLRKEQEVGFEHTDRNTYLLMLHEALWNLLEGLEESYGPMLRQHTNICDVVSKIQELISVLEQCTEDLPATTAIKNEVILAEILKHTDVRDLHHFRLVNRQWNYFATQALSHRKSLKISFNASVVENRFNANFNGFAISAIELDVSAWYNCSQSQAMPQFLQKHGPHVRTICLTGRRQQIQNFYVGVVNWLLNTCFSRVENLTFERDFWGDSIDEPGWTLNYPDIILPSLKHLYIKSSMIHVYLLQKLIRSAVNLETVQLSDESKPSLAVHMLSVLRSENKTELLKEYILSSDFVYESVLLASSNPVLEYLEVRQYLPRTPAFIQSVAQIMTSSRVTLTSLKVYAFNFILESNIVTLPNLKHLYLYNNDNCGPISAVFPNGTVLSIMFPRLESLVLNGLILQKNAMKIYFPGDTYESSHVNDPWGEVTHLQVDTLMTVKFLELEDCSLSKFGLNALAKKFPNVISIKFGNSEDFLQEDTVWDLPWPQLECLELRGLVFGKLIMGSSMDSIFTGFSEETCKELRGVRDRGETDFGVVDFETMTEYQSIRELRNLQKLVLVFPSWDQSVLLAVGVENILKSEVAGLSWLSFRITCCLRLKVRSLFSAPITNHRRSSSTQ